MESCDQAKRAMKTSLIYPRTLNLQRSRILPSHSSRIMISKIPNPFPSPQHFPSFRKLAYCVLRSGEGGRLQGMIGVVRSALAIDQFLPGYREIRFVRLCSWSLPGGDSGAVVGVKCSAIVV